MAGYVHCLPGDLSPETTNVCIDELLFKFRQPDTLTLWLTRSLSLEVLTLPHGSHPMYHFVAITAILQSQRGR